MIGPRCRRDAADDARRPVHSPGESKVPLDQVCDDLGLSTPTMIGWWDPSCPVRATHASARATLIDGGGGKLAIAIAGWYTGHAHLPKLATTRFLIGLTVTARSPTFLSWQPRAFS